MRQSSTISPDSDSPATGSTARTIPADRWCRAVTYFELTDPCQDPGLNRGGSHAEFVTVTVEPFVRLRDPRHICAPVVIADRAIVWLISRRHAGP